MLFRTWCVVEWTIEVYGMHWIGMALGLCFLSYELIIITNMRVAGVRFWRERSCMNDFKLDLSLVKLEPAESA